MKIILEHLTEHQAFDGETYYQLDKSKTIEFKTGNKTQKVAAAKAKLDQLKPTLAPNQKVRVHECHNDEPDETRIACKVLFES